MRFVWKSSELLGSGLGCFWLGQHPLVSPMVIPGTLLSLTLDVGSVA